MAKNYVNWGVIGCGRIAQSSVMPAIAKSKASSLYAIASRSAEKREMIQKKYRPVRTYAAYEELLKDPDVDAVYIPLPNAMHREWVLRAAENKKHILCEKPLGLSAVEVLQMKRAADENGVALMEAFAYRMSPVLHRVKGLIEAGEIGAVKKIETHYAFLLDQKDDYRLQKDSGGGAIYDVGCYNFNFLRYITGKDPEKTASFAELDQKSGIDLSCVNVMEYADGIKAVSICAMNHALCEGYRITGETGVLEVRHDYNACGNLKIALSKGGRKKNIRVYCPDNYFLEIEHFSKSILAGERKFIDFEDTYKTAQLTDTVLSQLYAGNL